MREYDVVVFGASGFTGRLVAEYLANKEGDHRWAIAGRNVQKLEQVKAGLLELNPELNLDVLIADSFDAEALRTIARKTKVVATTVGPYMKYGAHLVKICVEEGTDYCDLTGETPFIREMIDAHHAQAVKMQCKIVHCCGFDSIPSDLGCWMMQQESLNKYGSPLDEIRFYMGPAKGGFSGGTVASMLNIAAQATDKSVRKVLAHPYSLNPEGFRKGPRVNDTPSPQFDQDLGSWTAPFIMASINAKVVRRTAAMLTQMYGSEFKYTEVMTTKGRAMSLGVYAALGIFFPLAAFGPTRLLMQKTFLPAPGEGPSKEQRDSGFFKAQLVGKIQGEIVLKGRVKGIQDPGYGETAKMLSESALSLAQDQLPQQFGVLTPSVAIGQPLIDRLRAAGMTFSVEASGGGGQK